MAPTFMPSVSDDPNGPSLGIGYPLNVARTHGEPFVFGGVLTHSSDGRDLLPVRCFYAFALPAPSTTDEPTPGTSFPAADLTPCPSALPRTAATPARFNHNNFPTIHGPVPRSQVLTGRDDGPPALFPMKQHSNPWFSIEPHLALFPHLASLCNTAPRAF